MAKVQKNSESIDKNSFKNYELGRLLKLSEGINYLFQQMFINSPCMGNKDHQALLIVLIMQSDVQEEIKSRIPGAIDNDGYIHW